MEILDLGSTDPAWHGWRLKGRLLVSPNGDRLTPERLQGIVIREALHQRYHVAKIKREHAAATARVVWLPARERFSDVA
jgi:hypothetical protein